MSRRRSRFSGLAIALGLGMALVIPPNSYAEEPELAAAPAVAPSSQHVMGSGGLGSRFEDTVLPEAPGS